MREAIVGRVEPRGSLLKCGVVCKGPAFWDLALNGVGRVLWIVGEGDVGSRWNEDPRYVSHVDTSLPGCLLEAQAEVVFFRGPIGCGASREFEPWFGRAGTTGRGVRRPRAVGLTNPFG